MLFILDTDHASLLERGNQAISSRISLLPTDSIGISVITVEEQTRGRLAQIKRAKGNENRVASYLAFLNTLTFLASQIVFPLTHDALTIFHNLREQRIRIGTQDLLIASVALSLNATVATRNRKDFVQVPALSIEDWTS